MAGLTAPGNSADIPPCRPCLAGAAFDGSAFPVAGVKASHPLWGRGVYDLPLGPGPNGWAKNRVNISRICSGFWGIDPNHSLHDRIGRHAAAALSICCCIRAITASCIGSM